MRGHIEGQLGTITIESEVIARYAGALKGDSLTRGIHVEIDEDNMITIDFHVIVSYGVGISTVAENLIENVKYKVHEFTGLDIKKINIFVEGVRVID